MKTTERAIEGIKEIISGHLKHYGKTIKTFNENDENLEIRIKKLEKENKWMHETIFELCSKLGLVEGEEAEVLNNKEITKLQ